MNAKLLKSAAGSTRAEGSKPSGDVKPAAAQQPTGQQPGSEAAAEPTPTLNREQRRRARFHAKGHKRQDDLRPAPDTRAPTTVDADAATAGWPSGAVEPSGPGTGGVTESPDRTPEREGVGPGAASKG